MRGFGTVVTGTLVSGRIGVDDELAAAPGGRRLKVRGVQVHGQTEDAAIAGQRAAINLSGVEVQDLSRGQALVTVEAMKMEHTLTAPFDGQASDVTHELGAQVSEGSVLLRIIRAKA